MLLNSVVLHANPKDYWTNLKGLKEFKKENYNFAYGHFLESLQNESRSTTRLINVGRSYEALNQMDYALSTYEKALQFSKTPQERFVSLFNIASVQAKKKNVEEALKYYQQALEILPESKEVKHNIELLTQEQQGGGQGEGDSKNSESGKDQKNNDKKDPKKGEGDKDKPQDPKDQGKDRDVSKKYQMKPFKSDQLNDHDVGKIFEELKQQEQNIRQNMNKQEHPKESPSGKDW